MGPSRQAPTPSPASGLSHAWGTWGVRDLLSSHVPGRAGHPPPGKQPGPGGQRACAWGLEGPRIHAGISPWTASSPTGHPPAVSSRRLLLRPPTSASRETTSTVPEGPPIQVCWGPKGLPGLSWLSWLKRGQSQGNPSGECWPPYTPPADSPREPACESAEGGGGLGGRGSSLAQVGVVYTPNGTRMAVSTTRPQQAQQQGAPPPAPSKEHKDNRVFLKHRTGEIDPGVTYAGAPGRGRRWGGVWAVSPSSPEPVSVCTVGPPCVRVGARSLEPRWALHISAHTVVIHVTRLYQVPPWAWLCACCRDRTLLCCVPHPRPQSPPRGR